ncbi:MAG: cobalt ECF transporter T component CbiQ [Coriobacteriia bacterium]|nr:cobalt ECF transporter T component CbiQ [Coriobacteriia bacterium]
MPSLETSLYELGRLDRLGAQATLIHRIDPRIKVLVTFVYLVCIVSFGWHEILRLLPFTLYPVALASAADLPVGFLLKRLAQAAPFALLVGAFNPLLARTVVGYLGSLAVTSGMLSYASIILKFLLCTSAALVLISTTGMSGICGALRGMGVPDVFATQLTFLYRYMFLLAEEVLRFSRARRLRSFGTRGMGPKAYANILGHLLLRTVARARRIYGAMQCRGFIGTLMPAARLDRLRGPDVAYVFGWLTAFALFRVFDVVLILGGLVTGLGAGT